MLLFIHNEIHKLAEATSMIAAINDIVDLKFSPDMLSIMAEAKTATDFIVALQMLPRYFSKYICDQVQYSWIYLRNIYPIMSHLEQCGFSSFTFSVQVPDRAHIIFQDPHGLVSWEDSFELNHQDDYSKDVDGKFDYTTFVTMDSQQFIHIVNKLHMFHYVVVTLTNTRVKFSCTTRAEIILTRESGQCIIGGVAPTTEIRFIINLHSMETSSNLARQAVRIWLFKSINNSTKGVIAAVLGLDSQFSVYFPCVKRISHENL